MSAASPRRGLWMALGAICIVSGFVAAVLLWFGASQRQNSAIENFARAPIGCDTTLDFVEPGEYFLFVETVGTIEQTRGDCDVEGAFDSPDEDPDVDITLFDPDGDEVDLDRSFNDIVYDASGFRGAVRFSVDIDDTDDHRLRAESDADGVFVVAVGRDPGDGVVALRAGAIAAAVVGLLVGLALLLLGRRRKSTTVPPGAWASGPAPAPGAFVPGAPAPYGPPVYGQPGGPPTAGTQPPPPGQQPYGQPPPPVVGAPGPPAYGQPPAPQFEQPTAPPPPNIPGQPPFPAGPAASGPRVDWAPAVPTAPPVAPPPSGESPEPPEPETPPRFRDGFATPERPPPEPPQ